MDKLSAPLDWSLLNTFLAVARTGSLSAAARQLNASQPTVGRHIQAIEAQLGVDLFQRHAKGFSLTEVGVQLLPHAEAMEEAAHRLSLVATGQQAELTGSVRLTASVFVSHHILPPILAELRQFEPGITIELVASDQSDNLLFREADIALRMYRPKQLDVVAQHLGTIGFGAYASRGYLERHPAPVFPEDLLDHDLIGFDRDDMIIRTMREGGLDVGADHFGVRTDHPTVYWELVRAGCGIGFGQIGVGQADATLQRVLPDLPLPALELWLAAPVRTRQTPRISRVWDALKLRLSAYLGSFV